MQLTKYQEEMATGRHGAGRQRCMELLVNFGQAFGAQRMLPIFSGHTMPKEPPEMLLEMTEGVDQLSTFTTLHPVMSAFSPPNWERMGIPPDFAHTELALFNQRQEVYQRLGMYQTYTCLPMLVGNLPRFGEHLSWIGTGAQLMANSLLGARCNRDGTAVTLASAITGCTPDWGLHQTQNRVAQMAVRLADMDPRSLTQADWSAVGYYVGGIAQNRNLAFDGLPPDLGLDQLKYLLAPLSVSGSVALCHLAGISPEAPTLQAAFGGGLPAETLEVTRWDLEQTRARFPPAPDQVDLVIFGCPHCTISEIRQMAAILEGRALKPGKRLWIGCPHQTYHLAALMGYTRIIELAGGVLASACMAAVPDTPLPSEVRVMATNSFKAAHYITSMSQGRVEARVMDTLPALLAITA